MEQERKWANEWLKQPHHQYLNEEWVLGDGRSWQVINPADETKLTEFSFASLQQVEQTAEFANEVFLRRQRKLLGRAERVQLLHDIARLIRKEATKLAVLESLANGKLVRESLTDDIPASADIFDYYAGWVDKYYGVTSPVDDGYLNYTLVEPVGVCGLIAPWNFPLYQLALKMAPALAMGNAVIIKPSEYTPFTALYLLELIDIHLQLPKGMVSLVLADGETANQLTMSNNVHKVSFTGSTAVGKKLVQNSGCSNLKAVSLELGGKSPCIFFADTPDLEQAIDRAFTVMFSHKGEKCSEPTRFLIEESMYDQVLSGLIRRAEEVVCGDPFSQESGQGPQCNRAQFEKILEYIRIGKGEAELVAGGFADLSTGSAGGLYIRPTIFSDVPRDARIAKEEIFGPVLCCMRFKDEEEAISLANSTDYGLAAGVYTGSVTRAHRLAERLEAGMVFINRYGCYGLSSPFGGFKQSGWGKEMAIHSLSSYVREKSVWIHHGDG